MTAANYGEPSSALSGGLGWPVVARRMRALVKASCAQTLHASGLDRVLASRRGLVPAPLVIGYHRIVEQFAKSAEQSIAPQLTSVAMFERHLDWLGKRYDFVSLDELLAMLDGRRTARRPVAVITFDDGYQDVHVNALPVLRRKGIPGAIFVVTALTGTRKLLLHDELFLLFTRILTTSLPSRSLQWWQELLPEDVALRLAPHAQAMMTPFAATRVALEHLTQEQNARLLQAFNTVLELGAMARDDFYLLDWDQLRSMQAQDITVGSHTQTHALLTDVRGVALKAELEGSRKILEAELGTKVRHLAYPNGNFDDVAVRAAVAAGYESAYTVCRHRDSEHPLMTIPRTMLWEHSCLDLFGRFSPAILSCQINGIFDPAARCRAAHRA